MLGQGKGLARRLTALAAIYAFLLAGALATLHQHGLPLACGGLVCHSDMPGVHPVEAKPCDMPGGCLACLWSRASVANEAATGPAIVAPQKPERFTPAGESDYHHIPPLVSPARAPPSPSL